MLVILSTRLLTVSVKRRWCGLYWCDEAGLLAVQIGPIVLEIVHSDRPR